MEKADLLIRGGMVVSSSGIYQLDILIKHGKILSLGNHTKDESREIIDAHGLHVLPGVIDPQVHFRDPGLTHKEDLQSGSTAAISGGVTSFLEMPNTNPPTISIEAMQEKKNHAAKVCMANYNFFIGATENNLAVLNQVQNVCGIKIFMGASTGSLLVDDPVVLEKIFARGSRLIAVHAEDESILKTNQQRLMNTRSKNSVHLHYQIRSSQAALSATKLAVSLSKKYQRRLHILHLTTLEEVNFLRENKEPYITTEVCPQHLLLSAPSAYDRLGTFAQMNPPIREEPHSRELWKGLLDGTIDCMATDHAPHTIEEKNQEYGKAPSGLPGVETLLPAMLNSVHKGLCTLPQAVGWLCEKPAELYKLKNKGFIKPSFDADITLVDLSLQKTVTNGKLQCKVNWSPFHGEEFTGWPVATILGGEIAWKENDLRGIKGRELLIEE